MQVAVAKETCPGEKRVALIPAGIPPLVKAGWEVLVEKNAGQAAGYSDEEFQQRGAKIADGRREIFAADVVVHVRALGANLRSGRDDLELSGGRSETL